MEYLDNDMKILNFLHGEVNDLSKKIDEIEQLLLDNTLDEHKDAKMMLRTLKEVRYQYMQIMHCKLGYDANDILQKKSETKTTDDINNISDKKEYFNISNDVNIDCIYLACPGDVCNFRYADKIESEVYTEFYKKMKWKMLDTENPSPSFVLLESVDTECNHHVWVPKNDLIKATECTDKIEKNNDESYYAISPNTSTYDVFNAEIVYNYIDETRRPEFKFGQKPNDEELKRFKDMKWEKDENYYVDTPNAYTLYLLLHSMDKEDTYLWVKNEYVHKVTEY